MLFAALIRHTPYSCGEYFRQQTGNSKISDDYKLKNNDNFVVEPAKPISTHKTLFVENDAAMGDPHIERQLRPAQTDKRN